MPSRCRGRMLVALTLVLLISTLATGCVHTNVNQCPPVLDVPRELAKASLPEYVVEPPDILYVNAIRLVPLPPYHIEPLDVLVIQALTGMPVGSYKLRPGDQISVQAPPDEVLRDKPIAALYGINAEGKVDLGIDYGAVSVSGMTVDEAATAIKAHLAKRFANLTKVAVALVEAQGLAGVSGSYPVDAEGKVNLGPVFGSVRVVGKTLEEAETIIKEHLAKTVKDPSVSVALGQSRGFQQIQGEHLIRPDGTVGLGSYGKVHVAGMTLEQARVAIEAHLSQFLQDPQISVDVGFYSSKFYYVITDGGGFGEQVYRFNVTGNETVLDAISQISGLPAVSSKKHVWLARPAPAEIGAEQIFPIDWNGIARGAATATNYQVLPGDRVYVMAQPLVTFDTFLARMFSPVERVFGITLLANSAIRSFDQNQNGNNFP